MTHLVRNGFKAQRIKSKRMRLLMLLLGNTLIIAVIINPVVAEVTWLAIPQRCKVGTPVEIYISVAGDQYSITLQIREEGDPYNVGSQIMDPDGIRYYLTDSVFVASGDSESIPFPDGYYWDPAGRVDKEGVYAVWLAWTDTQGNSGSSGWFEFVRSKYSECVGGVIVSVDKFGLLAPYTGLASTIVVATVATAIYAKRVKHRKEKQ